MAGLLSAPGGHNEAGETFAQCACRETKEEVGIEVNEKDLEQVAVIYFYSRDSKIVEPVFNCPIFFVRKWKGDPTETAEMIPEWFNHELIPFEKMSPGDKEWLPLLLKGKKIIGHLRYGNEGKGVAEWRFIEVTGF